MRILRKTAITLVMLMAFGLLRSPWERQVADRLEEANLLAPAPDTGIVNLIGQSASLAVLGGLRPLVAIYTTLHAYDAWQYREWDTVERDYGIIHQLAPDDIDAWVTGSWHLHTNASASFYMDETLPQATRERLAREWVLKGVARLKEAARMHPRSAALHKALADVYRQKLADYCLAAEHYKKAMEGEGGLEYLVRFYGYFLARCPGKEREAYDYLMALYRESERHHLPTLIQRIKELEEKLNIPAGQRIPDPDPDAKILKRHPNALLP